MKPVTLPILCAPFLTALGFDRATALAPEILAEFAANDQGKAARDPSRCEWLVALPGGARAWSAKLAIDADGPAVEDGFRCGTELDPGSGQNDTSLKFANGRALPSEGCPYYVLPGGSFGPATGLALGDVCVVAYRGRIAAAIFGDIGPGTGPGHGNPKIGEGSIRLHNSLRPAAPDPCSRRDARGRCLRIRDSSIEASVICIAFPGSPIDDLALVTCQAQIEDRAFALYRAAGGKLPL